MASEIERKYLTANDSWRGDATGVRIAQGYLSQDPERTVRVRLAGEKAWITVKGLSQGITRTEFEYPVPTVDARALLELCLPSVIDKTRHLVHHGGHVWEIDVFHGANEGLVIAEVELADASEIPEFPAWLGAEVSADPRYYNSNLAAHPFTSWQNVSED